MSKFAIIFFILSISIACHQKATVDSKATTTAVVKTEVKNIDVGTFKALMSDKNKVILDVRTAEEVAQGQIEGALNIDYYSAEFDDKIAALDKTKEYLVYCRSGGRSAKSAKKMQATGFAKVYNLEGGYTAWSAQ